MNQWSLSARYPLLLSSQRSLYLEANLTRRHSIDQAIAPNPNTPKSYRKLKADYAATAFVHTNQQWLFKANTQAAFTNLGSSEKFSLGGANGVRGWPAGEASGDSGAILSAEWRYQFMSTARNEYAGERSNSSQTAGAWVFSAFADAGQITQHKNLWASALPAGQANGLSLYSLVLVLAYVSGPRWSINTQVARGLGKNPGRSATGLNSDGRSSNTQMWVTAVVSL